MRARPPTSSTPRTTPTRTAYEFLIGTDSNNPDSDGDGYSDGWEAARGYDPLDPNDPPATMDSDGDGIPDRWEMQHGMNPFDADDADADWDGDGLTNLQEYQAGSDIFTASTGGSGIPDGWAVAHGLSPVEPDMANARTDFYKGVKD